MKSALFFSNLMLLILNDREEIGARRSIQELLLQS